MARKPRDTWNYHLKDGRKTVYHGTTNNPQKRSQEHVRSGKEFTKMVVTGPAVSRDTALHREEQAIARYRRNSGRNPKYNKTTKG